jgi:hypothetical protein
MKKYFMLALMLILFFGCTTSHKPDTGDSTGSGAMSFDELVSTFKTAKDVENYMHGHFKWKKDRSGADSLKSVQRFMRDSGGDCEDFAYFIATCLQRLGYDAKVLSVIFKTEVNIAADKTNHGVAIFFDPQTNAWHYIEGYTNSPSGSAMISKPYPTTDELVMGYFKACRGLGDSGPSYSTMTPGTFESFCRNNPHRGFLE